MSGISPEAMKTFFDMTQKDPVIKINDRNYKRCDYSPVLEPTIEPLSTHTLQGCVDMIESSMEPVANQGKHIFIASPTKVYLQTEVFGPFMERHILLAASAYVTDFRFGQKYDLEDFKIAMLSQFEKSKDRDTLLSLVGSITTQSSGTISDDGISQSMEIKQGISMRGRAKIDNPFHLTPYRTFPEIEQPSSNFVFRIHEKDGRHEGLTCSLTESDGAKWKIEAINNIRNFFSGISKDIPVIA